MIKKSHFLLVFALTLLSIDLVVAQDWTRDDLIIHKTFEDLEPLLHLDNDTTYVINFWATWCGPCVKELPYFEALTKKYQGEPVKVVLVSLDFEKHIDRKVLPFLNKKEIVSEVIVLLDGKANRWIDKVDPSWSGAIPITYVRKGLESLFFEQEFHSTQELIDIVSPFLVSK